MATIVRDVPHRDYDDGSIADLLVDPKSSVVPLNDREATLQVSFLQGLPLSDESLQNSSCAKKYYRSLIQHHDCR